MAEEVRAPLAGTVLSVLVGPGMTIVAAAPSRETPVYASRPAAVRGVRVCARVAIAAGDLPKPIE